MAGPSPSDPLTYPGAGDDYIDAVAPCSWGDLRIAVSADLGVATLDVAVALAFEDAVGRLRRRR